MRKKMETQTKMRIVRGEVITIRKHESVPGFCLNEFATATETAILTS